jgi:putative Holliday junction resolvase
MARLLGLDPGTRRCGVAISDSAQTMAFPRPALANDDSLLTQLALVVDDESVASIVIGRPVALSGNETSSTAFADEVFAKVAARFDGLDVVQFDERLTTRQAQRSLSSAGVKTKDHRQRIDSAAAVVMLQHFLDSHRVG